MVCPSKWIQAAFYLGSITAVSRVRSTGSFSRTVAGNRAYIFPWRDFFFSAFYKMSFGNFVAFLTLSLFWELKSFNLATM